jgi:hypothetical protein
MGLQIFDLTCAALASIGLSGSRPCIRGSMLARCSEPDGALRAFVVKPVNPPLELVALPPQRPFPLAAIFFHEMFTNPADQRFQTNPGNFQP